MDIFTRRLWKMDNKMKTLKLIIKGILLYSTMLLTVLYIAGIDSIVDNGFFLIATAILASLIYICYKTISEKDANTLLLGKYFGIND